METVLSIINDEMKSLNINYYYMINESPKIEYPYVTGELTQNGFDYETMTSKGDLLLDLWTRNERLELIRLCDKLKNHFMNFMKEKDGVIVHIDYATSMPISTNDNTLKRLQVNLDVTWWKGAI